MRTMPRTIPFTRKLVVSIKSFLLGGTAPFSPASLFTGGYTGGLYYYTDNGKLWQNSGRSTAITAVEQPLGAQDDQSGNANHAIQATAGQRFLYSQRKNLQAGSGTFNTADWRRNGLTVADNTIAAPDSSMTASRVTLTGGMATAFFDGYPSDYGSNKNSKQVLSIYFRDDGTAQNIRVLMATTFYESQVDISTKAVTDFGGAVGTVTSVGGGWYRFSVTVTKTNEFGFFIVAIDYDLTTTNYVDLAWAQIENGSTLTAYQSVVSDSSYASGIPFASSDGVDDNLTATAGGGSESAFCFMACIKPTKQDALQTLFSDAGTSTGYKVELNASNQLVLSAGNGTAYTSATSDNTFSSGVTISIEAYDDGTNLGVRLDNGTLVTVARPSVVAGTAGFTIGKDNGAASGYFKGNNYGVIYNKNKANTPTERANAITWLRAKGGLMSICAIIPVNLMQSANDSLEQQGFGAGNFSVPLYSSGVATYGGCHAWNDPVFVPALKAVTGVIWEESDGDPTTRFNALVEAQGVKWGGNAPALPDDGPVVAMNLYRYTDGTLWTALASFDRTTYGGPPAQLAPAIIRQVREPGQVYEWKQPLDQFDAYKLLNPFTNQNDECMYQGKKWYVTAADGAGNNVWAPGVYGWSETDPTPNIFVRAWDWVKGLFTWK